MKHYDNLQGMRGIAAIMVILVHAIAIPDSFVLGWAAPFLGKVGPAGVDFFFVISGFIISSVAINAAGKNEGNSSVVLARNFFARRIVRIYPIYWLVLSIAILMPAYVHLSPATMQDKPLWSFYLLTNHDNNKIMAAWTLTFEMYFYLVVTVLLLLFGKRLIQALVAWSTTMTVVILWSLLSGNQLVYYVAFNPLVLEFIFGIVIAVLTRYGLLFRPLPILFAGIILFFAGADANEQIGGWATIAWHRALLLGLPCAIIIYSAIALEEKSKIRAPKFLQFLGDISYSYYIWHQLVFACCFALFSKIGLAGYLWPEALVLLWLSIGFGCAVLSYNFLERPMLNWLSGVLGKGKASLSEVNFRQVLANSIFLGLLASTPLFGYFSALADTTTASKISETSKSQVTNASSQVYGSIDSQVWPEQAGIPSPEVKVDPTLDKPSSIKLAGADGLRLLQIEVQAEGPSALYVGYQVGGKSTEGWHELVAGKNVVAIELPEKIDGNYVWIVRTTDRAVVKLIGVKVKAAEVKSNGANDQQGNDRLASNPDSQVWPEQAGIPSPEVKADPTLDKPSSIKLAGADGLRLLQIEVQAEGSSALYVGYQVGGKSTEGWHELVAGKNTVSINLPEKIDGNYVWIVRATDRAVVKLIGVKVKQAK